MKKLIWTIIVGYVAWFCGYFHALIKMGQEDDK